jgi:ABC-type lipoprotein export system ATPase subunit
MPDALCLDGAWKAFDRGRARLAVIEDVTLSVAPGTIVAVVASRAQGKTTLVRVASGTLPTDRGGVSVGGRELTGLSDVQLSEVLANDIGIATRSGPRLRLDVHAYVEMSLVATKRCRSRERRRRVAAVLKGLGVAACAGMKWEELSNWQQVLVEMAQAIVVRPRLLLVDDLADGLNLGKKQTTMEMLQAFARDIGCGVLIAASDHAAALQAEQIWQLSNARLKLMHSGPGIVDLQRRREEAHIADG